MSKTKLLSFTHQSSVITHHFIIPSYEFSKSEDQRAAACAAASQSTYFAFVRVSHPATILVST